MIGRWFVPIALALVAAPALAGGGAAAAGKVLASIDLAGPFATRSPWRLTVTQGPDVHDEMWPDANAPGVILPCISKDKGRSCSPDLGRPLPMGAPDGYDVAHFLEEARIVYPRGPAGRALLLIRVAGQYGGNGDHRVGTQLLAYDRAHDRFAPIFDHVTGRNNNQEVRYIAEGPLSGAVVIAEPEERAPFGYWITVNRLTPAFSYRQVLRYRSATRYGDGNRLAVIDSEMPNIQHRLGLWRPGRPLPLPVRCATPRLVKMELWCG